MISETALNDLKVNIESITKYRDTPLKGRPEWGTITFDLVENEIDYVLSMTSKLADMRLESLTDQAAADLYNSMPSIVALLDRIDQFDVEQGNASATRDDIARQIKVAVEDMHAQYSKWLPYLAFQRGDMDADINKIKDARLTATEIVNDSKSYVQEKRDEVDVIVSAARDAVAKSWCGYVYARIF